MSSPILTQGLWQDEKKHRSRLFKWLLGVLSLLLFVFVALAIAITQPLFGTQPPRTDILPIEPSKLKEHVTILAEKMFPRDSEHPENLDRVASYISDHFVEAHGAVVRQPFKVNGKTYQNVVGSFGPQIGERIVVGAHYDAAGEFPGSDDNASAVAGLLELAVLLGSAPPDIRVDLVAFTLEEPPYFNTIHMGSAVHAYSLKKQNVAVRIMISLEMIGSFTDIPNSQRLPVPLMDILYPTKGDFIAVIGKMSQGNVVRRVKRGMRTGSALPVFSFNAPAFMPGINLSDHINYWKQGYAAVMVTDTAFMRNSRYHTAEDKPDTLDYKRMAMTVQSVYAAVMEIARN
jgi:hypothetical protein